jgi:prepilin peptidase CpaA
MLVLSTLCIFPAAMCFAASSDLFTMKISNRVSVALLLGFVGLAFASGMKVDTVLWHLGCGLSVLAVTFALFAFGWIGGGDAKLAAATGVWLGFGHVVDYGIVSALLGGGLTLAIVYLRSMEMPPQLASMDWFARVHDKRSGVPYGIALAAAGLFIYPETALFSVVASQ